MRTAVETATTPIPWWKEPTKDQWYAWVASWLGWTLDAFDFTMFLLIMVPISQEFGVPLTEVAFLLSVTLWLRLVGAVGSGWLGDRIGRKTPLMISILWYSICNFIAGFSPTFLFLLIFRTLLGIGMGAEWPAGAALAMESWPTRSRGFMSGILQGSWGLGFARMASAFCVYYSIWALFATYLQRELQWTPGMVAVPLFWANIVVFGGNAIWGLVADRWGRKPGIYIPAIIGIFVTPLYLYTN